MVEDVQLEQEYPEEHRVLSRDLYDENAGDLDTNELDNLTGDEIEYLLDEAINELNEKLEFEGIFHNPKYNEFDDVEDAFNSIRHKMWGHPDYLDRQKKAEYLAEVAFALEQELSEEEQGSESGMTVTMTNHDTYSTGEICHAIIETILPTH